MPEILLVLAVILIFFGAKKLPELAKGMGQGIKEFKKATRAATDEMERADSVFAILPVSRQTALGPEIRWHSVADKSYRVQRATALGLAFETVSGPLPATPPVNAFIDKTAPKEGELFYRILKP